MIEFSGSLRIPGIITTTSPRVDESTALSHDAFFNDPFAISRSLNDIAALINEQSDHIGLAYAKGRGRSLQGVDLSLHPVSGTAWQDVSGFLGELWFDGPWSYGLCAERDSTDERALIAGLSIMPGDQLRRYYHHNPTYSHVAVENPSRTAIAVELQAQESKISARDGMKEVIDGVAWEDLLVDAFVAWGHSIRLDRVGILPAALNKYQHKVPFARLKRRYDDVAARHGFEPEEHGIYFLTLSGEQVAMSEK